MRSRQLLMMAAAVCLAASSAMAASPKIVYVQVPQADIREGKTPSTALVVQVTQGTRLTLISEEGVRYLVETADGRKGYISKLSVSTEKPSTGGLGGLAFKDDRDITERSTAASGRGLSEAAKNMAKNGSVDPNAIKWVQEMEVLATKIKADDIKRFRKEGGLQ